MPVDAPACVDGTTVATGRGPVCGLSNGERRQWLLERALGPVEQVLGQPLARDPVRRAAGRGAALALAAAARPVDGAAAGDHTR